MLTLLGVGTTRGSKSPGSSRRLPGVRVLTLMTLPAAPSQVRYPRLWTQWRTYSGLRQRTSGLRQRTLQHICANLPPLWGAFYVVWFGWSRYDDPSTRHAVLSSQMMKPIRALQLLPAKEVMAPHPRVTGIDFGQNIAGWGSEHTLAIHTTT